jgi:hypothetical protein
MMADVTDPVAIKFVNEAVRPLAEEVRAIKYLIDNAASQWFAGVDATIGSSILDAIDDGRESQGVSRLTAKDITDFLGILNDIKQLMDTAAEFDIVLKPCVRSLRVT